MTSPRPAPISERRREATRESPHARPGEAVDGASRTTTGAGVPRYLDSQSPPLTAVDRESSSPPGEAPVLQSVDPALTPASPLEPEPEEELVSGADPETGEAVASGGTRAGGDDGETEGGEGPVEESDRPEAEAEVEGGGGEGGGAQDGGDTGGAGEPEASSPAAGGDLALIDEELAEHERWAGSFGGLGTAGGDQRARFLLNQAGQGASSGAVGGLAMGFAMGAIGAGIGQIAGRRLATMAVSRGLSATPVPGLGAAIGGVMAVAGLAMRDWSATGQTINRIGTGEGYERLANDLEGLAEVLDVACSIMDVVGGVLGGIAVGMWVAAVLSAGTLSPLAASLSAIALGINLATTAVGVIINVVVRPTVTAMRALHAFESQGDPAQVEANGAQLQAAAAQVTGAAAGALGGRLGGAAGSRGGTRIDRSVTALQARGRGGAPAMSAGASGPRVHVEVPEAPARPHPDAAATAAAHPAETGGPAAASPARPPESFADLDGVVADLHASPELAARLSDTRAPLQRRATPWDVPSGEARAYANQQAASHRAATGMSGGEVQAGHTAAARHAAESGIREADWDTQPMMDLHSRRGQGLDVATIDPVTGQSRTRTRHTAQEGLIDTAVGRAREAQGELTPRGQLDAADQVAWATENMPWRQGDIDAVRAGGLAPPARGAPVDPATGRVIAAGGATPADSNSARIAADAQLQSDVGAARQRVEDTAATLAGPGRGGTVGMREGSRVAASGTGERDSGQPMRGPEYTAAIAGLQPGQSFDLPVNPAYSEPPGTPAELDALRAQAELARQAQAELAGTEHGMAAQATRQRGQDEQLGEAEGVTQDLAAGGTEHQGTVAATRETNTRQQSSAGDALSALGRSAQEGAALTTLVGSLRVFQGLAGLFSYLPGDLGRRAEGASGDADRLIAALGRVSETEGVQANVEQGRGGMEENARRIESATTQGQTTEQEVSAGQEQVCRLRLDNAESLAETEAVRQQARDERRLAGASEEEARMTHDDLNARMREWAQAHRQAREDAINSALARYRELGYPAREAT